MEKRHVLVTGATGLLGPYVVRTLERAGRRVTAWGGPARPGGVDLEDAAAVEAAVAEASPAAVVHVAALAALADCARDPGRAARVNVDGTAAVVRGAEAVGARVVHVSTDLVFDGEGAPYGERAVPSPLSEYGRTKRDAERVVLAARDAVAVRVSLLFGPSLGGRAGFFDQQLGALRRGEPLALFDDEWRTPLSLAAAADGLVAIVGSSLQGVIHLGGPERMTRWEMGLRLARHAGLPETAITKSSRTSAPGERRPCDVSLDSSSFRRRFPALRQRSFEDECARMGIAPA